MKGIRLSEIDERRFGIRTARADGITVDALPSVMDFCRAEDVSLLIARCSVHELRAAQEMELEGFSLMDTLVYYRCDLEASPIPQDRGKFCVRPIHPGDEHMVKAVAAEAFKGYHGHYHADRRLDYLKCDEAYTSWALRSCLSRQVADEVLLADLDGSIGGFATLRLNSREEGEGVLFGVAASARRRGVYRSLMIGGMEWCLSRKSTGMVVSTQITNIAVQKIWVRLGFEPGHYHYTFHKWFD